MGVGHSSPVVVGDRVFQFSRIDDAEVVQALDLASGKSVWRQSYPAPYTMNMAAMSHGKGPKSTPLVEDGRVFTLGISGILSAFDAASGRLLWRKEFGSQFKETSPLYGVATSPIIDQGTAHRLRGRQRHGRPRRLCPGDRGRALDHQG